MKKTLFSLTFAAGAMFGLHSYGQQNDVTTTEALSPEHIAAQKIVRDARLDQNPLATPYGPDDDKAAKIHWNDIRDTFGEVSLKKLFATQNKCKKLRDHVLIFVDDTGREFKAPMRDLENAYQQFLTSNRHLGNWHGALDVIINEQDGFVFGLQRHNSHAKNNHDADVVMSLHTLRHMSAENIRTVMAHEASHIYDASVNTALDKAAIHAQLNQDEIRADSVMFLHMGYTSAHHALVSLAGHDNHHGDAFITRDSTVTLRHRQQEFGVIVGLSQYGHAFDNVHPTNAARLYKLMQWQKMYEENAIFLKPAQYTPDKRTRFKTTCDTCTLSAQQQPPIEGYIRALHSHMFSDP